jgi:hypothetical protein
MKRNRLILLSPAALGLALEARAGPGGGGATLDKSSLALSDFSPRGRL